MRLTKYYNHGKRMTFSMLELQHERKKSARTPTHTRTTLKFVQPAIQFFRVTPRYDGD